MFFEKVSLVTGGFDPIHSGHIRYFEKSKRFIKLSGCWSKWRSLVKRKKGQYFQSWTERADIIRHLNMVDAVVSWDDVDDSACGAIEKCLEISQTVVFCNGGDRAKGNTPELDKFGNNDRVKFEWAVGGTEKMNSSSWILHGYFERQRKLLGI